MNIFLAHLLSIKHLAKIMKIEKASTITKRETKNPKLVVQNIGNNLLSS